MQGSMKSFAVFRYRKNKKKIVVDVKAWLKLFYHKSIDTRGGRSINYAN